MTRYFDGVCFGIQYTLKRLNHCLSTGIRTNEDNVQHEQLLRDKFKGYTLTKQAAADDMAEQVQEQWQDYLDDNDLHEDDIDPKQARNMKINMTKDLNHGFIGYTIVAAFISIIHVCHAWW